MGHLHRNHRPLFHQNADLSGLEQSPPWQFRDLGLALFLVFFVASCYVIGAAIDEEQPNGELQTIAAAEAERLAVAKRMAEAYAEGQRAAHEALQGKPQGLQLAQACMASGFRRQP